MDGTLDCLDGVIDGADIDNGRSARVSRASLTLTFWYASIMLCHQ